MDGNPFFEIRDHSHTLSLPEGSKFSPKSFSKYHRYDNIPMHWIVRCFENHPYVFLVPPQFSKSYFKRLLLQSRGRPNLPRNSEYIRLISPLTDPTAYLVFSFANPLDEYLQGHSCSHSTSLYKDISIFLVPKNLAMTIPLKYEKLAYWVKNVGEILRK